MAAPIYVPSVERQGEIVRWIGRAFTWIERLASEATSARKLFDRLDPAVLAKAFRGELVPQDPNDEPASALLERIRAERAVASAKRGVRMAGRRSWRIGHVGRPRSGVHRVTCPTCAGEDGEQELPPMYDPREDLGR